MQVEHTVTLIVVPLTEKLEMEGNNADDDGTTLEAEAGVELDDCAATATASRANTNERILMILANGIDSRLLECCKDSE